MTSQCDYQGIPSSRAATRVTVPVSTRQGSIASLNTIPAVRNKSKNLKRYCNEIANLTVGAKQRGLDQDKLWKGQLLFKNSHRRVSDLSRMTTSAVVLVAAYHSGSTPLATSM